MYIKCAIISSMHIHQLFCDSKLVMKVTDNPTRDKNLLSTFSLLFSFKPTWLPLQEELEDCGVA